MSIVTELIVDIRADVKDFKSNLGAAQRDVQSFSGGIGALGEPFSAFSQVAIGALREIGATAVNIAAGALRSLGSEVLSLGKQGIGVAVDYQSSMNMFAAVSGATAEQMAKVSAKAKELGGDMTLPATSAGDAGKAMTELAKAGLSVTDSLDAAKGVLQLSAAGQLDNAKAAEITANALNAFSLKGTEAGRVADLLAAAANASSAEVTDVAASLQQVSAIAAGAGIPIEQVTAAIAEMANKGIKGSDAGTSIKTMLLALQSPTDQAAKLMGQLGISIYDANGKMKPFPDLINQFSNALADGATHSNANTEALGKLQKASESALKKIPDLNQTLGEQQSRLSILKQELDATTAKYGANSLQVQKAQLAYETMDGNIRKTQQSLTDAKNTTTLYQNELRMNTESTTKMTQAQRDQALATIFGSDASRAARIIMLGGKDAFDQTTEAVTKNGAASELAGAQMKGLGGAWQGFQSTVETTLLSLSEPLLDPLEKGVRALADGLTAVTPTMLSFVTTAIIPLANETATFLDAFVQSPNKISFLTNAISSAFTSIQSYVSGNIGQWITTLAQWGGAAVQWIEDAIPAAITAMSRYGLAVLGWVVAHLPEWYSGLSQWATIAANWVLDAIPGVIATLASWSTTIFSWVVARLPEWVATLRSWASAAWQWIELAAPQTIVALMGWRDTTISWVMVHLPDWLAALGEWAVGLATWAIKALPSFLANMQTVQGGIFTAVMAILPGLIGLWPVLAGALTGWVVTLGLPLLTGYLLLTNTKLLGWVTDGLPGWLAALGKWGAGLGQWITDAWPWMLQKLGDVITNVIGFVGKNIPVLINSLSQWSFALLNWITTSGPGMLVEFGGFVGRILDATGRALPGIVSALAGWAGALIEWVVKAAPQLLTNLYTLVASVLGWIGERIPIITQTLGGWASSFWQWVEKVWPMLMQSLGTIFVNISNWIVANGPDIFGKLAEWGRALVDGVWNGMNAAAGKVTGFATQIGMNIKDKFAEWYGGIQSVGGNLIDGLWNGITGAWGRFMSNFQGLIGQLPQSVRTILGIASPSKVFAELGSYLPQGLAVGIQQGTPSAIQAVTDMASALPQSLSMTAGVSAQSLLTPTAVLPSAGAAIGVGIAGGSSSGSSQPITIHLEVYGNVQTERDLVTAVQDGLLQLGIQRGGSLFGGRITT